MSSILVKFFCSNNINIYNPVFLNLIEWMRTTDTIKTVSVTANFVITSKFDSACCTTKTTTITDWTQKMCVNHNSSRNKSTLCGTHNCDDIALINIYIYENMWIYGLTIVQRCRLPVKKYMYIYVSQLPSMLYISSCVCSRASRIYILLFENSIYYSMGQSSRDRDRDFNHFEMKSWTLYDNVYITHMMCMSFTWWNWNAYHRRHPNPSAKLHFSSAGLSQNPLYICICTHSNICKTHIWKKLHYYSTQQFWVDASSSPQK